MNSPKRKIQETALERRRHKRTDIELNARVFFSDDKTYIPTTVHNISEGGAFVELKRKLDPGTLFKIKIELAPGLIWVEAEAEVVYYASTSKKEDTTISTVEEMESFVRRGHLKGCGIRFTKLSKKDQKFLHTFVEAIS